MDNDQDPVHMTKELKRGEINLSNYHRYGQGHNKDVDQFHWGAGGEIAALPR